MGSSIAAPLGATGVAGLTVAVGGCGAASTAAGSTSTPTPWAGATLVEALPKPALTMTDDSGRPFNLPRRPEARMAALKMPTVGRKHHDSTVLTVDHIIIAVVNLDAAGRALAERHGLASYAGGRHPDAGTANRVVPLQGAAYLEMLAVVDPDAPAPTALVDLVRRALDASRNLAGWAVGTDDIGADARRLGIEVTTMSRVREDGTVLTWQLAGVAQAVTQPWLPFFIQWDRPERHPAREALAHDLGAVTIQEVEVAADAERLSTWLGPGASNLPLRVVAPRRTVGPGVWSVALTTERAGMVRLGREGLFNLTGRMPRGIVRRG